MHPVALPMWGLPVSSRSEARWGAPGRVRSGITQDKTRSEHDVSESEERSAHTHLTSMRTHFRAHRHTARRGLYPIDCSWARLASCLRRGVAAHPFSRAAPPHAHTPHTRHRGTRRTFAASHRHHRHQGESMDIILGGGRWGEQESLELGYQRQGRENWGEGGRGTAGNH